MRVHAQLVFVISAALALCTGSAHAQRRSRRAAPAPAPAAAPAATSDPNGDANDTVTPSASEPAAGTAVGTSSAATPGQSTATPSAAQTSAPVQASQQAAPAPAQPEPDTAGPQAELQRELSEVMDSLVQARARAAVLGKALWKSRVAVKVDNRAGPDQVAVRLLLWLDGAPIWSGDGAAASDPERTLFSGFVAPGQHVLTYEVEQRARADEKYRYTQRASHRFTVLREHNTELRLVLDDDSDIADDFADDDEGEYDVRTRLEVRAFTPGDE